MPGKKTALVLSVVLSVGLGCKKSGEANPPAQPTTSSPAAQRAQRTPGAVAPQGLAAQQAPWMYGAEKGLRPTLLVANFSTQSDDGLPWGSFFSRLLSEKLNYAPNELFSTPIYGRIWEQYSFMHYKDEKVVETQAFSDEDAVRLARMFGLKYLVTGKIVKSGEKVELRGAVQEARTNKELAKLNLSGSAASVQKMLPECCKAILKAVNVEPSEVQSRYLAREDPADGATFLLALKLYADQPTSAAVAAKEWKALYTKDPGFTLAKVTGLNFLAFAARDEALAELRQVVQSDPDQGRLDILRIAQIYYAGRYGDVIREVPGFLQKNPNNATALYLLARAYERGGMYNEATAVAERLVELKPDSWRSRQTIGDIVNSHAWKLRGTGYWRDVPPEAQKVFPGMTSRALREMRAAAMINPFNPDLHAAIGGMLVSGGHSPSDVEAACYRAIEIQPDHWSAHYNLVRLYMPGWSRQHEKALLLCRDAATKNPDSASMQWLMAEYLLWYIAYDHSQTGKTYEDFLKEPGITMAIEESIEKSLALDPTRVGRRESAASYYSKKHDYKKAWAHYAAINELPSRYAKNPAGVHEYWKDRAWAASQAEQWDAAIQNANMALTKMPCAGCREKSLCVLAWSNRNKKNYDEAIRYYEMAAQMHNSNYAWACRGYADVVLEHRPALLDKGLGYAQNALAADPKDANTRVTLARCYLKRNQIPQVREQIQAALMLDPDSSSAKDFKKEHPEVGW